MGNQSKEAVGQILDKGRAKLARPSHWVRSAWHAVKSASTGDRTDSVPTRPEFNLPTVGQGLEVVVVIAVRPSPKILHAVLRMDANHSDSPIHRGIKPNATRLDGEDCFGLGPQVTSGSDMGDALVPA